MLLPLLFNIHRHLKLQDPIQPTGFFLSKMVRIHLPVGLIFIHENLALQNYHNYGYIEIRKIVA